jgi:hypothetical protein
LKNSPRSSKPSGRKVRELTFSLSFYFFLVVLGFELRTSCSTTQAILPTLFARQKNIFLFFIFAVLGLELRASHLLILSHSTSKKIFFYFLFFQLPHFLNRLFFIIDFMFLPRWP